MAIRIWAHGRMVKQRLVLSEPAGTKAVTFAQNDSCRRSIGWLTASADLSEARSVTGIRGRVRSPRVPVRPAHSGVMTEDEAGRRKRRRGATGSRCWVALVGRD